jgi:hypothetical protein
VIPEQKARELEELRQRVRQLEEELARSEGAGQWPPRGYYLVYHVTAGFVLGMFGAATSLLLNIIGSLIVGQHPLQLIRVYLTFPLGEAALRTDDHLALAVGCCLYLATGMLFGVPFHLILTRFFSDSSFASRFMAVTTLALGLWLVNFYLILSWLQPLLFGGDWIVAEIPWWVAALTHLVFGWTMLLVQPWGVFVPYRPQLSATEREGQ